MKSLQFEINQKSFLDCAMFRSLQLKTAQELRYNDNPLFFRVQHFLIFVFGLSNALLSNSMNFLILQVFPRFWCLWIVPRLIEIHTNPQKIQDFLKTPLNERKQSKIKKIVYNKLIEKISLLWVNLFSLKSVKRVLSQVKLIFYLVSNDWVGVQRGLSYLMRRRCLFSLGWPPFQ